MAFAIGEVRISLAARELRKSDKQKMRNLAQRKVNEMTEWVSENLTFEVRYNLSGNKFVLHGVGHALWFGLYLLLDPRNGLQAKLFQCQWRECRKFSMRESTGRRVFCSHKCYTLDNQEGVAARKGEEG